VAPVAKTFQAKRPWAFSSETDDVIPVSFLQSSYQKLQKGKAEVRHTEFSSAMHNSWGNAFAEPEPMSWLFSKLKK
jgi:predicted peptidase